MAATQFVRFLRHNKDKVPEELKHLAKEEDREMAKRNPMLQPRGELRDLNLGVFRGRVGSTKG